MAKILLRANLFPMVLAPRIIKGKFTMTSKSLNEIFDFTRIKRETPVAPPSINSFGSRKPFSPKPAADTPIAMNKPP